MRGRRAGVAVALAVLLAACSPAEDDGVPRADVPSASAVDLGPCPEQPDQPAAGAELLPALTFDCPGGGSLDLARAPGVPTVVNLWGSWCAPCREELPLLQQLAEVAGDRLRVVGVISRDGLPQANSFAADAGITFPAAFDGEGALMTGLGLNALPFTYFLDADGGVTHTQVRPVSSVQELRDLVAEHLGVAL